MKNIEVEIRSFISEEKYNELLDFFSKNAELFRQDPNEVTYYFDCKEDLRIQKNADHAKLWLKKGKIHDEHREEIEVKVDRNDFELLEKFLASLGYNVAVKWHRKRHLFRWEGIEVSMGHTRGYGYIIELEKMSDENEKQENLEMLKGKLKKLGISLTQKEEFNEKY